jgi:hypothetical protein
MLEGSKRWLRQSLTVYPYEGLNVYGERLVGGAITVPCRLAQSNKRIISNQGNEVISTCQITVDGAASTVANDKIALPDGTTPTILTIQYGLSPSGATYAKVIYT